MISDAETQGGPERRNDTDDDQQHISIGEYDVAIDNDKVPYLGVIASSIILLIAVNVTYVKKHYKEFGISLGSIALIISCLSLVKTTSIPLQKFALPINYFLFCFSFVGACVMTFGSGPFDETGNGYFASWALVVFSAMTMGMPNLPGEVKEATTGMASMFGLVTCAVVVFIALLTDFKEWYWVRGEIIFSLIVCLLTIIAIVNFAYARIKNIPTLKAMEYPTLAVMTILWILAACCTTFRGPFLVTSNGYLASWGGCILGVKATMSAREERNTEED